MRKARQCLAFILVCCTFAQVSQAQVSQINEEGDPFPEPAPSPSETPLVKKPAFEEDLLPDITAKTYSVSINRRSNSNKIYLISFSDEDLPKTGRILLFKKDEDPIMGFRVLKTYPTDKLVAAKRIRRYSKARILHNGENYIAIEKVAELDSPSLTIQDISDLKELEKSGHVTIDPFDPELDTETTPVVHHDPNLDENSEALPETLNEDSQLKPKKMDDPLPPEDDEGDIPVTVEDSKIIDHYNHWLTAGFGYIRNRNSNGQSNYYFTSGNVRYGINILRRFFLDQPSVQDSLTLEGGIYPYKALNFATQGDSYTVLTFTGALRYNLIFSEKFAIYFYGSMLQSNVVMSTAAQNTAKLALSSLLPGGGGGLFFQIGPCWYTRVELGMETATINLTLRF